MDKNIVENKSIKEKAIELYKKLNRGFSISLCLFVLFTMGCLLLGYFYPDTLLLSLPFIALPSFFAFMSMNTVEHKEEYDNISFFMMFRNYFSILFFGAYRVLVAILKGILAFVVGSSLTSFVGNAILLSNNEEFRNSLIEITKIVDNEKFVEEYIQFMNTNVAMGNLVFFSSVVGLLIATYVVLHHISVNQVKPYFNWFSRSPLPAKELNFIHKNTYRKIKKSFRKDYYANLWFLIPLILIGFSLGTATCYFFILDATEIKAWMLSLFFTLLLFVPFMNYYSCVLKEITRKYAKDYMKEFIKLSYEVLEEFKKSKEFSEAKEKEIKDFLEKAMWPYMDDVKKENKQDKKTEEKRKKKTTDDRG